MADPSQVTCAPGGTIKLPEPRLDSGISVESALRRRRSVREFDRGPLTRAEVSQLLWSAQGVTNPDGRRTAPSAGALYPLEIIVAAGKTTDLPAGLYRYRPYPHELLLTVPGDLRAQLAAAALEQYWMAEAPITFVIAAVYERASRRYRQRAERYVHMEVGHVAQNVHLQAVALGLGTVVVGAFDDAEVKRVLSLDAQEQPLCLLPIGKPRP